MTASVSAQLLHIAVETRSWTLLHALSIAFSFFLYFTFAFVYNALTLGSSLLTSSSYMVIQVFIFQVFDRMQ
jgi:phospholipid-translocating ATPase